MTLRTKLLVTAALVAASVALAAESAAPPPGAPPAGDPSKAEGRFKNIQVLKGYPADDVIPTMQFISNSLGVDCDFCHVEHAPEKDDKMEKQTARKMVTMMMAINKTHFEGHRAITCMSCHNGKSHPTAVPAIGMPEPAGGEDEAKPAELPAATAVLDKYVNAVGGAAAIGKVQSRVQKGKLTGFGPEPSPVEVSTKSPDKRVVVVHNPRGENTTAFDGKIGWTGNTGRPAREMSPAEVDAVRLDAMILLSADPRSMYKDFKVLPPEKIEGKDTVHVMARTEGKPPAEFYFDPSTGLLVRLMRYSETPLGRNPTQIDYADYRDADGVKIPFRWTVARPMGKFTIQLDESKQNVPVDDKVFQKPAAPAPTSSPS